jgi:uncharacterized protein
MNESGTATTLGAREHARAQGGQVVRSMRTVPAPEGTVWHEVLDGGRYTGKALARGTRVRFTDLEGEACAQLLLFNALAPWERLNVADTAKVQWQAYLGPGSLLLTDMGRVIATIVSDSSAHHDLLCGSTTARPLLTLAVSRFGLDRRDVHPCVNLFKQVLVVDGDRLEFAGGGGAAARVELRLELPAYVVVANSTHVLDERDVPCTPLEITAIAGDPADDDDQFRNAAPEATRAFENTEDFLLGHPRA